MIHPDIGYPWTHTDTSVGLQNLGRLAIGPSTIAHWEEQGLELTTESLEAAGQSFKDAVAAAFTEAENQGNNVAGTSISLDKHQIVKNHQETPDWFSIEHFMALRTKPR